MEAEERDITIGPGKLLGLFFMLVAICGVFFAIGYSLGKTSAREQALNDKTLPNSSLSTPVVGDNSSLKPSAGVPAKSGPDANAAPEQEKTPQGPDLTFFNAVKKSDSTQTAGPAGGKAAPATSDTSRTTPSATAQKEVAAVTPPTNLPEATVAAKGAQKSETKPEVTNSVSGAFVVQIAAVTREEDAAALAGALRKKSYNVFVVNNPAVRDKFYHVQVGPFATLQDAEAMKARLTSEGYNPIVKKS